MGVLGAQADTEETAAPTPAVAAMAEESPTVTFGALAAESPTSEPVAEEETPAATQVAEVELPASPEPVPSEVAAETTPDTGESAEPAPAEATEAPAPAETIQQAPQAPAARPAQNAEPAAAPASDPSGSQAPLAAEVQQEAEIGVLATASCDRDRFTPIAWTGTPQYVDDACGSNPDDMFTQGSKEGDPLSTWQQGSPSSGASTDIVSTGVDIAYVGDDPILYFGFNRYAGQGDGGFYLELNQKPNTTNSKGALVPDRTVGDLRFAFTTSTNSGFSQPTVYEWNGSTWVVKTVSADAFTYRTAGDTAEFTFNLSALITGGGQLECGRLAFNSLYLRSTASAELSSSLKDFVTGAINVNPCPSFQIEKRDMQDNLVGGATFRISPDPRDRTVASVTVTDNGAGDDSPTAGIIKFDEAKNGAYTVEEITAPTGYLLPATDQRTKTATVTLRDGATLQFADPRVPTVTKTASATFTETYVWAIEKTIDGVKEVTYHVDGTAPVVAGYDVEVSLVGVQRSNYALTGTITVVNPDVAMKVRLTDALGSGEACTITGVEAGTGNLDLPTGTTTYDYSCIGDGQLGDIPLTGTNNATLTVSKANWATAFPAADGGAANASVTGSVAYTFSAGNRVNQSVTITDTFEGATGTLGTVTANDGGTALTAPDATVDGLSATFSYDRDLAADAAVATCAVYDNTATITQTGQTSSAEGVVCVPEITLVKSASPATYDAVGDEITYTLTATNTGQSTLTHVTITDAMLGLADAPCATTLAPGASCTVTDTHVVTQVDLDAGSIFNTATATGTDPADNPVSDDDDETVTGDRFPAISLTKEADVATYDAVGDVITYSFVSTNTGNVTLTNVTITDPLSGLSALTCDVAAPVTLAPGESLTCSATYSVTQADLDNGIVENTATTVGTPPVGDDVTDTDEEDVTAVQTPAINLVKSATPTIYDSVGDVITYSFVATNTGNVTLTDVTITDPLPGLSALTCDIAAPVTLAPGAELTCSGTYAITQADLNAGSVYNEATAEGTPPQGDDVTATDDETVTGDEFPAISLTKTADVASYDSVGDVITYSFVATNTGNVTLSNVTITDPLPGLSSLTCDLTVPATLDPGAQLTCSATYSVTQADLDNGSVDNTATTSGTSPANETVNATADESVPARQAPAISLVKEANVATYDAVADVITYSFVATNTGNVTLTDVTITDPLPGLSALTCDVEAPVTLAPGESLTCSATYSVTQADVDNGIVENTATTVGTPPVGDEVTDTDEEDVTAVQTPAISLVKTADVETYDAVADVITYSFVATNTGNVTLTDVTITDPLPGLSALTCDVEAPVTLAPGESLTCSATYSVTQADLDNGIVENTATTVGTPPVGDEVTDTDEEDVTAVQTPAIALVKSATPLTYDEVGDVITYSFVATNTGNVTLTDVMITDPLTGLSALTCDIAAPVTLAPGAELTCSGTYAITQADLDAGSVFNEATAVGTPPQGDNVTDTDDQTVTAALEPAIDLVKTANVDTYDAVGDVITYSFVATNIGNLTLTNVMITDPLPGLSALTCDVAAPVTLAPGESLTCSATYSVTQADLDNGMVENTATTVGTPPQGDNVTDTDEEDVTAVQTPAIDLVKTADVETYDAVADVITYSFVATNTGNVTLTDVTITDPLPGLSALTCDVTAPVTLAPGESLTCSATYSVTQADLDNGIIENTATTVGTPPQGDNVTDTDEEDVTAVQTPAIDLVKTADVETYDAVADVITYSFVATNTGNVTLTDVTITDPLPGLSAMTCDVEAPVTLAPGESLTCSATYSVTQPDLDNGMVENTATTVGTPPVGDDVTDTDEEDVTAVQTPAISLVKSASSPTYNSVGDEITYTFVATNTGNVTLTDVTITDPLDGLSALTCVPAQGSSLAPEAQMTCTATYVVDQADLDAGSVYNEATTSGNPPVGQPVTDSDDETVTAAVEPAILLVKTANVDTYDAVGDVITYSFVATNIGNVTLTDVSITDPLPGLSGLTCDVEAPVTLAPGESLTCSATYSVTQADLDNGIVENTATTIGTPPQGDNVTDTDEEDVTATQLPAIDLVKTADVETYDAVADVITYSFVATNIGNVTLTDVSITDPLPGLSGLTCDVAAPVTLAPGESLTCSATYSVTQADLDNGIVENSATTVGTPPVGDDVTDTDEEDVTAVQTPAISLVKTADVETYDAVADVIT
ncbi:beta strand repeat-containing protein, partial [Tessaracoccus lubricantis]|uniref:beta strand repeat-containing protein n=1 Tax=Tessaracoccus lubricantis TaxID=545543 RepID=UPI00362E4A06